MKNSISVFLSHSHKDIDRVRKIRDVLEMLNCEPIVFYLKCLDDDNDQLEDFIKREIDSRNIFLYCKSHNSENSVWVKKEIDYIKSKDKSRLYTIDIDEAFEIGLVTFLTSIMRFLKNNTIIIYHALPDINLASQLGEYLGKYEFRILYRSPETNGAPTTMKKKQYWEYDKYKNMYKKYFDETIVPMYLNMCNNGIVITIITNNLYDGDWSSFISETNLNWLKNNNFKIINLTDDEKIAEKYGIQLISNDAECFDGIVKQLRVLAEA